MFKIFLFYFFVVIVLLVSCNNINNDNSGGSYDVVFSLHPVDKVINGYYTYSSNETLTLTAVKTNFNSYLFTNNYFTFSASPANVLEVVSTTANTLSFRLTNMSPGTVTITATATNAVTVTSANSINGRFEYTLNLKKANYSANEPLITYQSNIITNNSDEIVVFQVATDRRNMYGGIGASSVTVSTISGNTAADVDFATGRVNVNALGGGTSVFEIVWINPNYINQTNILTHVSVLKPLASACTPNARGLKITEVSTYWIELYNTNQTPGSVVCLADYKLRAAKNDNSLATYAFSSHETFPDIKIQPGEYFIIRFAGVPKNSSSKLLILTNFRFVTSGSYRTGLFELTFSNVTVGFVNFCKDSGGSSYGAPTTGVFSGCLSYTTSANAYGSFSLSEDISDKNNASDWTYRTVVTFGGKNDVTDVTDNDRDGIPDENEQPGKTFAGMPLYDWGARAGFRDLFVHVNYMDGRDTKAGLTPFKESFDKIKLIFANNGFEIHSDLGTIHSQNISPGSYNLSGTDHEVPYNFLVDINEQAIKGTNVTDVVSIINYKNTHLPLNRFGIFHYALMADTLSYDGERFASTLGVAELPGNDFLVFTGHTSINQLYVGIDNLGVPAGKHHFLAAVFMHELGHNLNLGHGGHDHENYKPNYFSIMNYGYTIEGVPLVNSDSVSNFDLRYYKMIDATIDGSSINLDDLQDNFLTPRFNMIFSSGSMPFLNENGLTERNPLGAGIGHIDWNLDGHISIINNIQYNLNPRYNNSRTILTDHDDWENLQLPFDHSIADSGYGNLNFIGATSKDSLIVNLNSKNVAPNLPPKGSGLVGRENMSPVIIDQIPLEKIIADISPHFESTRQIPTGTSPLKIDLNKLIKIK